MRSPVDDVSGEPMPFPYLVRARYQFQIDGVIAGTIVRAVADVAPRDLASQVAALAVDAVETSRRAATEATHEQRILSLDALSEWGSATAATTAWSRVADVASRSIDLINAAGSDTLRTGLTGPLERIAAP